MDLIDSLKWALSAQYTYRLAAFRTDKTRSKVISDKFEVALSLLYFAVVATVVGFTFYKTYYTPTENFFQIGKNAKGVQLFTLVAYLEFSFSIINAFYFLITALFTRHGQMNFIEKVQKIDETLRGNFRMEIDYGNFKVRSMFILITIIVYYNLIVSGVMYFYLLDIKSMGGIFTFAVYIIQSATSGVFTYGFVTYVVLLLKRMLLINEKLAEIVRFPPEVLEKHYKNKDAMCADMMRYTKIYKSLCVCVDDLNKIYGSSMVLQFAHDFTLLTTQIFAMFYIGVFENTGESLYKMLALLVWLLPNIVKMSFICYSCHVTTNEVETCGLHLRKFSLESNEDDINDFVDMFSLQSIHIKTEFTASNFFSIDMSLFFTIISACTTYLVILIQFKNYEDESMNTGGGNATLMTNLTSA